MIDQICLTRTVCGNHTADATVLADQLRAYASEYGPETMLQEEPDETTLARCLAIAPLGDLIGLLNHMRRKGTRCGERYPWFVTLFAHRIRKIKSRDLAERLDYWKTRKPPERESNSEFAEELLSEAARKLKTVH